MSIFLFKYVEYFLIVYIVIESSSVRLDYRECMFI